MLIPVLIVSSLVHCYSIGYMSSDPQYHLGFCSLSWLNNIFNNNPLEKFTVCHIFLALLEEIGVSLYVCLDGSNTSLRCKTNILSTTVFTKRPEKMQNHAFCQYTDTLAPSFKAEIGHLSSKIPLAREYEDKEFFE